MAGRNPSSELTTHFAMPRRRVQAVQALPDRVVDNAHTQPAAGMAPLSKPSPVRMGTQLIDLSVLRTSANPLIIPASGNFFWFSWSTNLTDSMTVQLGSNSGALAMMSQQSVGGIDFDRIIITNAAIGGASATVGYGQDDRIDRAYFG